MTWPRLRAEFDCRRMAASWPPADHRGANLKKMMTVEQLFAAPKNVRKRDGRLERAKLTMAAAREQAAEMAMARAKKYEVLMRPTVLQRHRLAKRLSSAAEA
jgi:hypothetical protein